MDTELIRERRKDIEDSAPCEGCGSSLASCKANRGKDPTAPPWFGCCARGLDMRPCRHVPDPKALAALIEEIETGNVRTIEQVLLDSMREFDTRAVSRMLIDRGGLDRLHSVYNVDYYAYGD